MIKSSDQLGYGAAKSAAAAALSSGASITEDVARKLAQEVAGDGYGMVAAFGRTEFVADFAPVRLAWQAELDGLLVGDADTALCCAGLSAFAAGARLRSV